MSMSVCVTIRTASAVCSTAAGPFHDGRVTATLAIRHSSGSMAIAAAAAATCFSAHVVQGCCDGVLESRTVEVGRQLCSAFRVGAKPKPFVGTIPTLLVASALRPGERQ